MKVAIPHWQGRVSPVFDVAGNLLLADIEDGKVLECHSTWLTTDDLQARANHLADLGVDLLICGAISWPLERALCHAGVDVFAQTCGEVEDVLEAFVEGRLEQDAFLMPGCCGRRRARQRLRAQFRDSAQPEGRSLLDVKNNGRVESS